MFFFLYKIARLLDSSKLTSILLFWAITPFLLIVPYSAFQSDHALIAFMVAGAYFWISELKNGNDKLFSVSKLLTFFFIILGGVLKLVPLVFLPFILILFSRNIKRFFIYSAICLVFYMLISQPWAGDTNLYKQFFLYSKESLAIFNFQLNGVSVFLFGYLLFFLLVFIKRSSILLNAKNVLYIITILLSLLYITEDNTYLLTHFNLWVFPFIGLLTLVKKEYSIFFLAPVLVFFTRMLTSIDLAELFDPALGFGFHNLVDLKDIFSHAINPNLLGVVIQTSMVFVFGYFTILLFSDLFNLNLISNFRLQKKNIFLSLSQISLLMFAGYFLFLGADFVLRTRLTLLPTLEYIPQNSKHKLSRKPLEVIVDNTERREVNGIEIQISRGDVKHPDTTNFEIIDSSKKSLAVTRVNDLILPKTEEYINFVFPRSVNNRKFVLKIFKEKGLNDVWITRAKQSGDLSGNLIYDRPDSNKIVSLTFQQEIVSMRLRGKYTFQDMIKGLKYHIIQKPKFFIAYFGLISVLALSLLAISFDKFKKMDS